MTCINLASIQSAVAADFCEWTRAALQYEMSGYSDSLPTEVAKSARSRIYGVVKYELSRITFQRDHGLYLFSRPSASDSLAQVLYIGLVKGAHHSLQRRMWDHLAKELSSLDPLLYTMDIADAEATIKRRLRVVLPLSQKIDSYCIKHLKGRRMSQAETIMIFPTASAPATIENAETALILSSSPQSPEERLFVNQQKLKSTAKISAEGIGLAERAIKAWCQQGLGAEVGRHWLERLSLLKA